MIAPRRRLDPARDFAIGGDQIHHVAIRPATGAARVPGECVGRVPRAPAASTQPPGEVDILLVHEEVLVEHLRTASRARLENLDQGRAAIDGRRTVNAPDRAGDEVAVVFQLSLPAGHDASVAMHYEPG